MSSGSGFNVHIRKGPTGRQRRREQGHLNAAKHTPLPGGDDSDLLEDSAVDQAHSEANSAVIGSGSTSANIFSETAKPSGTAMVSVFANILKEAQGRAPLNPFLAPAPAGYNQGPVSVPVRASPSQAVMQAPEPEEAPEPQGDGNDNDNGNMDVDVLTVDPNTPWRGTGECFDERYTLEDRVRLAKEILEAVVALGDQWAANDKPACGSCSKRHPPPCVKTQEGKDYSAFKRKARGLIKSVEDPTPPAEEQSKGGKRKRWACTLCARWHAGGEEACKAPLCEEDRCGLHHFLNESCDATHARFVQLGMRKPKLPPAQPVTQTFAAPQGGGVLDDADVLKLGAIWDSVNPDQLKKLTAALGKRKAEEEPKATAAPPSKKPRSKQPKGNAVKEQAKEPSPAPTGKPYKGPKNLEKSVYGRR